MSLPRRGRDIAASLRGFEGSAAVVLAASLGQALLEGASVGMLVPFLEAFRPGTESRLGLLIPAVAALLTLRALMSYLNSLLGARLQVRVLLALRESLATALYRAGYEDLAGLGPGRLVNLFSLQADRVASGIAAAIGLLNGTLLLMVYVIALVVLSWRLSLVAAVFGAAGFAVTVYAGRRIRAASVRMARAEEDSSRLVHDDAAGLHVVQAFDVAQGRLALHREVNTRLFGETMALHRWRSAVRPATEVLYALSLLGAVWVAVTFWPQRVLAEVPAMVAFAFVLLRLQGQVAAISDGMSGLAEQEGSALNVFAFLSDRARGFDGVAEIPGRVDRIAVEGVGFRYDAGPRVLTNLDLELRRGEVLAVVGASGAGKSTLAQLLVRLRSPQAGRITIEGLPVDQASRESLARNVGVAFEDAFVFDESADWNVTLGRDVSREAVDRAVGAAGLADVIGGLAEGGRTRLGPGGGSLSAGQRQRLSLARAIVGLPLLLVLDEATSALDGETERLVTGQSRALRPDGFTLVIAHRLSTVLSADRVALLEGGRIVATGSHEHLLETSPSYRRLVETQLFEPTALPAGGAG